MPVISKIPNFLAMKNFEYLAVRFLFFIFDHISLRWGKRLALLMTFVAEKIIRYRRQVVLENLHRVYGEQLPKPRKQLLHEIYKNFVFLWMEFLQSSHLNKDNIREIMRVRNPEIIRDVAQRKHGHLFVSGHFGNFEWLGQLIAIEKIAPITGIAKKQSNHKVNDFIVRLRERNGLKIVYTKQAMQVAEEALKRKEIVAIAFDQDARKRGVFVNFLGIPSSTAVGTAVLHLRTGAKIILIVAVRRDYALFDVFLEEVRIPEPQGDMEKDIVAITQAYTSAFEKWVRRYPEQWLWMHKRWKTQPENS